MVRYLTGEEILYIHHQIIEKVGGSHGVRDMNLFLSTIERPQSAVFGEDQFPTIFLKAATYLEGFTQYQIFIDGNKRTAFASVIRFLFVNDYLLTVDNKEVEIFVMKVSNKEVDIQQIATWLEKYSQPNL